MKKLLSMLLALCLCAALMVPAMSEDKSAFVLMNIPYADFYAAESDVAVDAETSAPQMKSRAGALAGGFYHVDPEGSDISGVIYPVYVEDTSVLADLGGVEITDKSNVEITVTLKGEEQTATYAGKDALFEAPSYSWYVLDEQPAMYKTLETGDAPAFSAIEGKTDTVAHDATASIMPFFAPMPLPTMMATGVARPNAQGQEITSTEIYSSTVIDPRSIPIQQV